MSTAAEHLQEVIDVGCTRDDHDHVADHRAEVLTEAAEDLRAMQALTPDHSYAAGMYAAEIRLRQLALRKDTSAGSQPPAGESTEAADRIMAYRSYGGRVLRCLEHAPTDLTGFTPVASEDLTDGGICTLPECGQDVLIAPEPVAPAPHRSYEELSARQRTVIAPGCCEHNGMTNGPCPDHPMKPVFFRPDHLYVRVHHGQTIRFLAVHVSARVDGSLVAFGWRLDRDGGGWEPSHADDLGGWTDITEAGEPRG